MYFIITRFIIFQNCGNRMNFLLSLHQMIQDLVLQLLLLSWILNGKMEASFYIPLTAVTQINNHPFQEQLSKKHHLSNVGYTDQICMQLYFVFLSIFTHLLLSSWLPTFLVSKNLCLRKPQSAGLDTEYFSAKQMVVTYGAFLEPLMWPQGPKVS